MGRPRLYKDLQTQWRERKRRQRRAKKPYFMKQAEMRKRLEDTSVQAAKAVQGVYDVVVVDPPWPMEFIARKVRPQQVSLAYLTMTVEQIRALELPLAEHAHVWLWTTQRFLPEALTCLAGWGLTYGGCFVWEKPGGMQPVGLFQMNCELALYARKGAAVFVDTKDFKTCFEAPRGEHSAKPDAFYDMVRRVTAGRRLDMFARRRIEGFDAWGYEAPLAG